MNGYSLLVQFLGGLFLLDLVACVPFFREAFPFGRPDAASRRGEAGRWLLGVAWLAGSVLLLSGRPSLFLPGAILLMPIFRHYFIGCRWTSSRRGFGAPGFMSHFTVLYLVVFEVARSIDVTGGLLDLAFFVFRIDFAVIMICAGAYKALVGFFRGEGMEYGCVNPLWGYFWRPLSNLPPGSAFFRLNNFLASTVEIVAGILMLLPPTQPIGGVMISLSFLYIAILIRLGRLAFLMAALPALYLPAVLDAAQQSPVAISLNAPGWLVTGCAVLLWTYVALLPLVKGAQYYNLFGNRRLPGSFQRAVTAYSNFIPIIMWRVFTPDVTNFFVRIRGRSSDGEEHTLVDERIFSLGNWRRPLAKLRFLHVGESIAMVSVFTLRKYYPSRPELFRERLLGYSDSLRGAFGRELGEFVFEYVRIVKRENRFSFERSTKFFVDLAAATVRVEPGMDGDASAELARFSPIRESISAGSYVAR